MSAASDFISAESANILKTAEMLEELVKQPTLTRYEVIALGKLLQDIYTEIERILRAPAAKCRLKIDNWKLNASAN